MNKHDPKSSYSQHHDHDSEIIKENKLPSCYSDPDSIDAWLHTRMYNTITPLIEGYRDSSWLTVGDGKYGSDGYFLKSNGVDVTASSLSDVTLVHAQKLGYLDKILALNAEHIDADDGSYDFVLCKGAYHHFPRPPVAFYEMLRVCRKGMVLIEPNESSKKPLNYLKILIKKALNKDASGFEPSGNYIYKIDMREIARMMTALNYEVLSYSRFNDFYHPKLADHAFNNYSFPTLATRAGLMVQNVLCALKLLNYGMITTIVFKEKPSDNILHQLSENRFTHIQLPINPYRK